MMDSTTTVVGLFFFLVVLIVLLVFLYKKLNREADGEYTVQRIIYKKGGVRDQLRGAAMTVGTHLGIELWPSDNEEGEDMERVEEGQVEGDSGQDEDERAGEDKEEDSSEDEGGSMSGGEKDKSSSEGSEGGEEEGLLAKHEVEDETEEIKEEKQENEVKEQGKVDTSGGTGLLIDLKQFSGSAIWSEEDGGQGKSGDVTAL